MASGQTILQGWRSLGRFVSGFFVVYLLILTFVFGAAAISASALAFTAMFPILPLWAWAEHRNGIVSNIILVASVLLFIALGVQEVLGTA
jgi:hypothetical protein